MAPSKYSEEWLEREFIGYGFNTPNPQWPNDAKVCITFIVQYYMGAENSQANGDARNCVDLLEIPKTKPTDRRYESTEQMYEYGAREGVPRLLALFNKYKVPVTWNFYARAIERQPYWVKSIQESGAELSLGGYKYKDNLHEHVAPEVEDGGIKKSIDILQSTTGDKSLPHGWMVEHRSNLSTKLYSLAHQERDIPLLYSGDSCQDELPYWIPRPGSDSKDEGMLMLPYTYDTSDLRFNMRGSGWASPQDWAEYLRDTYQCLYEEAEEGQPKMMTVLLHPHIVGRPNRVKALESFIQYVQSKGSDTWIARRIDVAEHWKARFPYDAEKSFGQTKVPECGPLVPGPPLVPQEIYSEIYPEGAVTAKKEVQPV